MILVLFRLEILALFGLLCFQLLLLLLEPHIVLGVARVWRSSALRGLNILGMDCGCWASVLNRRAIGSGFRTGGLGGRARVVVFVGRVDCATFFGGYCAAFFECAWLLRSSDRRLAVI